jgi:hypothetical protein
MDQQKKS